MLNERFWSKVNRGSGSDCWLWTANKNNKGYGLFRPGGTAPKRLAHRLAYEDHFGPIPGSSLICHHCDNPPCVNPNHLFIGTHKTNHADMVQKGRRRIGYNPNNRPPVFRGDEHWSRRKPHLVRNGMATNTAKLSPGDVGEIYRLRLNGQSYRTMARQFGLDPSSIADICKGLHWAHLLGVDGNPTLAELLAVPNAIPPTKLHAEDIPTIRALIKSGRNNHQIAAQFGVHHATISDIRRGKTWAPL